MNRSQRRKAKKDISYLDQIKKAKAERYVKPFKDFIDSIESGNILLDQNNNVVMNMNGAKVKDMVDRNLQPYKAIDNINIMIEIFQQVCMISLDEHLDEINELCSNVRINFLNKLKGNLEFKKSNIQEAKLLIEQMILVFSLVPVSIVNNVKTNIKRIIDESYTSSKSIPSNKELKSWIK